jgi:hypothetical protein
MYIIATTYKPAEGKDESTKQSKSEGRREFSQEWLAFFSIITGG